jgi:hypothetical protein
MQDGGRQTGSAFIATIRKDQNEIAEANPKFSIAKATPFERLKICSAYF